MVLHKKDNSYSCDENGCCGNACIHMDEMMDGWMDGCLSIF